MLFGELICFFKGHRLDEKFRCVRCGYIDHSKVFAKHVIDLVEKFIKYWMFVTYLRTASEYDPKLKEVYDNLVTQAEKWKGE